MEGVDGVGEQSIMTDGLTTRTISVHVERDLATVYDFAAEPRNYPRWATGLCSSIAPLGDRDIWLAQTPYGPMKVRFTPRNVFGVLDHYVTPESGAVIYVPMRVIVNGAGSEVTLTLFRQPDMSDAKFAEDAEWVARDLRRLKDVLEGRSR